MDPEMFDIIEKEKKRQQESVDLIPSEVSCLSNVSTDMVLMLNGLELYL